MLEFFDKIEAGEFTLIHTLSRQRRCTTPSPSSPHCLDHLCHWRRNYYMLHSRKICKETALHYSNLFPHSTERKTATVTGIFVASKKEQHQLLHCSNYFSQEYDAVEFPVTITENNSPEQSKVCNNLSPVVSVHNKRVHSSNILTINSDWPFSTTPLNPQLLRKRFQVSFLKPHRFWRASP